MKKPIAQFLIWSVFLNPPLYAQEAIEIEIDSAPVEVEIHQPVPAEKPEEPARETPVEDAQKTSDVPAAKAQASPSESEADLTEKEKKE